MLAYEYGLAILRIVLGLLFIGHGAQKLFGWFGGLGWKATKERMSSLGFKPAGFWTAVAALVELLGGLGLTFGFLTPIASALILGALLMAIVKIYAPKGLWSANGGAEYPLLALLLSAFIGLYGPGSYALDTLLKINLPIPSVQVFWIAAAVAVVGVIIGLLTSQPSQQVQSQKSQS